MSSLATQFCVKLFVNTPIVFALIQLVRLPRIKGIVALEARLTGCTNEQQEQLLARLISVNSLLATSNAAGITQYYQLGGSIPHIHSHFQSSMDCIFTQTHTKGAHAPTKQAVPSSR